MPTRLKTLSIILPLFNEEKFVYSCLKEVIRADSLGLTKELIIINDGSTDRSTSEVHHFLRDFRFRLADKREYIEKYQDTRGRRVIFVNLKGNRGKGYALRQGFRLAKGDIILIQDTDQEYQPTDYPFLLQPFLEGKADVVYGSRFGSTHPHRVLYFWHYLGNKLITTLSNMLTNLNLTDVEVGYKLFRRWVIKEILPHLKSDDFGIEVELTARLARLKAIKVYEVGVSYWGRTYQEGKKINWWDGLKAIWYVFRYNLLG